MPPRAVFGAGISRVGDEECLVREETRPESGMAPRAASSFDIAAHDPSASNHLVDLYVTS